MRPRRKLLPALLALGLAASPAAAQQPPAPPAAADDEAGAPVQPQPGAQPESQAQGAAGRRAAPDSFESSEEISKDLSVSYPVDI